MEKQTRSRKPGKLKKILIISFIILVLILSGAYLYLRHTLPETEGSFRVQGIGEKVRITRNNWGVPFIETKHIEDLFFAVGLVHAQDRLFQMDLMRRLSTGRLAEIFGQRALETDRYHKGLLIEESIEKSLTRIDPEINKLMQNYCRGVNYFIHKQTLPPEFLLLGYQPGEWQPKDILSIFKRMEIILSASGSELYNLRLVQALGKEKAKTLIYGTWGSTIVNEEEYKRNSGGGRLRSDAAGRVFFNSFQNPVLRQLLFNEISLRENSVGSNNWVISGEKTASGLPLLANDPHLSNIFPSYFYQVYGKAGDFEMSGNTLPGVPLIIIGRNKYLGWGLTNVGTDVIDYFILKLNPENKNQYEWEGEWRNFDIIEKRIKVKDKEDDILRVKISHLGPVQEEDGEILARHSIGGYPSTIINAFYQMNFAKNVAEFTAGLRKFSSPAQNVVFADREGNIGYYPTGSIPRRRKGSGELPQVAVKDADTWDGFVPEAEKPFLLNPEKGYIATANNPVLPEGCLPLFVRSQAPSFRADRIAELIEAKDKIAMADIEAMQTDSLLKSAQFLVSRIRDFKFASQEAAFVHDQLKKWDFKSDSGISPFLFYRFRSHLALNIFKDDMGSPNNRNLISTSWTYRVMDYPQGNMNEEDFAFWVDDRTTAGKEDFREIVRRSLIDTYKEYAERSKKEDLTWRKLHTLTYSHPLGAVPLLKVLLNRGPYPMPGGTGCILTAGFRGKGDFRVSHLATFRMIIDFSDFANSLLVNSSGQSGHFMSPHYDDQVGLYVNLKYRKMEHFSGDSETLLLLPQETRD
jgi:penicillin amidase